MTAARWGLASLAVAALAAAFFVGRGSVDRSAPAPRPGSFDAGYRAGREDAFSGFDGGWSFGVPYIVTLRRGPAGVTYRFARRWTLAQGREYRRCGSDVCSRPSP